MPKAHQRYADRTPASLIESATKIGVNVAIMVKRMMSDQHHPEQGYRSAMGILALGHGYGHARLEAACDRALVIATTTYASVHSILKSGLDQFNPAREPNPPTPIHGNIRGAAYNQ